MNDSCQKPRASGARPSEPTLEEQWANQELIRRYRLDQNEAWSPAWRQAWARVWRLSGPRDWVTYDGVSAPGYGWRFRPLATMLVCCALGGFLLWSVYNCLPLLTALGFSPVAIDLCRAGCFLFGVLALLLAAPVYAPPPGSQPDPLVHEQDHQDFQRRLRERMED